MTKAKTTGRKISAKAHDGESPLPGRKPSKAFMTALAAVSKLEGRKKKKV